MFNINDFVEDEPKSIATLSSVDQKVLEIERCKQLKDNLFEEPVLNRSWEQNIYGNEEIKNILIQDFAIPVKNYPHFDFKGVTKSYLFLGPLGSGKRCFADALLSATATAELCPENDIILRVIKPSIVNILCPWKEHMAKNMENVFRLAREKQPSVIYLQNVQWFYESLYYTAKEVFINEMEKLNNTPDAVFLIGTSDEPERLPEIFMKQIQQPIYFGLPDLSLREQIFKLLFPIEKHNFPQSFYSRCAKRTKGLTSRLLLVRVFNKAIIQMRLRIRRDGEDIDISNIPDENLLLTMEDVENAIPRQIPDSDYIIALRKFAEDLRSNPTSVYPCIIFENIDAQAEDYSPSQPSWFTKFFTNVSARFRLNNPFIGFTALGLITFVVFWFLKVFC